MNKLTKPQSLWPYGKLLYGSVAVVTLLMIYLTYATVKLDPQNDVSLAISSLVRLSILLPIIFIWVVAARSARRFKDYAYLIRKSPEGDGMNRIANGLLLLVVYIIAQNAASSIVALFRNSASLETVIALTNHLPILFALLASWQLLTGAIKLVKFNNCQFWNKTRILILITIFLLFLIPFAVIFYFRVPEMVSVLGLPRFSLPANVLLITYVLPHSLVWLFGIISAVDLNRYSRHVSGKIYKKLFKDFRTGVILVYLCIFFAQLIMLSPVIITNFSLGIVLIYVVLALAIVGFQYIFRGARKLQLVEETI